MGAVDLNEAVVTGVTCAPLKVIADARGAVLHMLRPDSPLFSSFGEIYFSEIECGAVKAWRRHSRMTQRFAVPAGRVRIALWDVRSDSPTKNRVAVWMLGRMPSEYRLLVIPPGIWYGFQGVASGISLIANCPDIPYDSLEVERRDAASDPVAYRWPAVTPSIS